MEIDIFISRTNQQLFLGLNDSYSPLSLWENWAYKKALLSLISGSFCLEEVAKPGRVACPYATAAG
jgi:hypothetical protein